MDSQEPQNYIITGATGLLGKHVARLLAESGNGLFLVARDQQSLDDLQATLKPISNVFTFSGDLTNPEIAAQAISVAADQLGTVNGLIHLIGQFPPPGFFKDTPISQYSNQFQLNFLTALNVTQPLLSRLTPGASLIYMTSFLALEPIQGMGAYSASKAALVAWIKTLARETRPHVRVNIVSTTKLDSPEARSRFGDKAAARLISPEDVAHVILLLTTPKTRSISGAVIPVYGNFTLEDPTSLR